MSNALQLYLSSARKSDIRFCLIIDGNAAAYMNKNGTAVLAGYFNDPQYVKVSGNRPLLFVLDSAWIKSIPGMSALITQANPYIVAQSWDAAAAASQATQLGADAIGSYSGYSGTGTGNLYSSLATLNQAHWTQSAQSGKKVVPTVSVGWDQRPRAQAATCAPWDASSCVPSVKYASDYYASPTSQELSNQLKAAMNWVQAQASGANVVLMYAWNELSEGGWLVPTKAEGTARLDALRSVLNANTSADTTPPTVSIPSPANGAALSGTVGLTARASDIGGVSKVEFYVDGILKATVLPGSK